MKCMLNIEHGWMTKMDFKFEDVSEASRFLETFISTRQPGEDDEDRDWEYRIIPILDETKKLSKETEQSA